MQAFKDKLIVPILVGPAAKIRSLAETMGIDLGGTQIVDVADSRTAATRGVELARNGAAQMLMKGSLHTDEIMGAVVSREGGMRTGRRISHVFALDVPAYHKTLFVTDAAINIQPDLETKVSILQNAIDMMRTLEVEMPKVAILVGGGVSESGDPFYARCCRTLQDGGSWTDYRGNRRWTTGIR